MDFPKQNNCKVDLSPHVLLQVFLVGLIFSFLGSIPPGTLNILVLQLGLEKKVNIAMRFALAVAIIEYPYTWIAVVFEDLITSSPVITKNFELLGALVMTVIGIFMVWSARKPSELSVKFSESGFRRGLVLSILNPQAIPFWIAVTAYLKMEGWIRLDTNARIHSYVLGTSVGVLLLLTILAYGGKRVSFTFQSSTIVRMLPGAILLVLGAIGLFRFFFLS
jgi:threonine/homoserine/homoserine lactone efflux protein